MRMRLSVKISLLVVAAAVAAGVAVAFVDYDRASQEMRRAAEDKLLAVLQARADAIESYLRNVQWDLRSLSTKPDLIFSLPRLTSAREELGPDGDAILRAIYIPEESRRQSGASTNRSLEAPAYAWWHDRLQPRMADLINRDGYHDLLLIDLEGNVAYSVRKRADFATNVLTGDLQDSGLARAFREALANQATSRQVFVDFSPYPVGGGELTAFVAVVISDGFQVPVGVVALELTTAGIDDVMGVTVGLGLTGETLIVGSDMMLRRASRLGGDVASGQRASIDVLEGALVGKSGVSTGLETEADGSAKEVLVAYQPLDFLGTRWVVAAKADLAEVDAPTASMRNQAILSSGGIALLVALAGLAAARLTVVGPMNDIIRVLRRLAKGDREAPLQLRPREDEIGDIGRALSLYRDSLIERDRLDAENRREAALVEAGRRFRLIAEAQPHPVVVVAPDWTIRYANPAAMTLLRLSDDESAGVNFASLLPDGGEMRIEASKSAPDATDQYETTLQRPDGTEIFVSLSARSLDYDGAPSLVIGIVDLTEREAARAEIERQREQIHQGEKLGALGSLLAGVAHELNNPLSIVVGQAMMFEDFSGDPESAARGTKIRVAAERCARIVKTFLSMARQQAEVRAAVDLNDAVNGCGGVPRLRTAHFVNRGPLRAGRRIARGLGRPRSDQPDSYQPHHQCPASHGRLGWAATADHHDRV